MTNRQWIGLWLFAASALPITRGAADSIWDRRDPRYAYLWMDNRARRIGDLLTVTINESTGANNTEQRKMKKDTAASGKFNFSGKTAGASAGKAVSAAVSADNSSDRTFEGSAQFQSNRQFQDELTVTVKDILPNGNLVVEGSKYRKIGEETKLLRVSGVVRPNDIDITNTVSSQFIADPIIVYEGGGVESRFTNQGWVGRFTNRIWPY